MKKQHLLLIPFLTLVIILSLTAKTFAQAPQQFNYQGAARNASGTPLVNRNISLRLSIVDGSPNGTIQYSEVRTVTTNTLGLYSVIIGSPGSSSKTGTIASVTWQSGLKYIRVEVDPNNGSDFNVAGTAQLLSVPYALYAANGPASTPETITTLTDNKDGTYSYKSENNTVTLINVPASVKNSFQDILSDNNVKNAITQLVNQNAGNVSYDVTNQRFTYRDVNGSVQTVNLAQMVKGNETVTTLTDNKDGTYSYKSENNTVTLINVPASVKNSFQDILSDNTVKNAITQLVNQNAGNVSYDVTNQRFTYRDVNGAAQTVNLAQMVKGNETVTTLIDNGNGTYTYNNEKGTATIINVGASVKNNFQDILNDQTVRNLLTQLINQNAGNVIYDIATKSLSFKDASGNPQVIDIAALVKSSETITTVTKDPTSSVYTYKNEAGVSVNIDVIGDVTNSFSNIINNPAVKTALGQFVTNTKGAVSFNATNNQFSYIDASGNPQVIDIAALVKSSETITTVTKDPTSSIYTYKNEAGVSVNIDVIGDVTNSFSNIINNPAVKTLLEQFVTNTKGAVSFNATNNQFSYTDASGNPQVIDIAALVKSNETITTVTKDPTTSIYTYKNEAGANVNIDVIGDVKNSFSDIINNPAVKNLLEQFVINSKGAVSFNATNNQFSYTDASGNPQVIDIAALVKSSETITTVTKDPTTSIYTYKNEAGANVNIDVIGDVKNSFSDIINNPAVKNLLEQFVTNTKGAVSFNATNNQFSYTDASGNPQVIDIAALVKSSETITTVTKDPTTSIYTYKNEAGANVNIDVIGDVKNSFSDIINNPAVKTLLEQFVTNTKGTVSFNATNNQFSYTDASGNPQVIDIAALVKSSETITTVTKDPTTSVYTYKNEAGANVNIDVIGDVKNSFSDIINNPAVKTMLEQFVTNTKGTVSFNATNNQFSYTDASGNPQVIDIAALVKSSETITTVTKDPTTSIYTYKNEAGANVNIDVIGDVKNSFSDIINNPAVKNLLEQFVTNTKGAVSFNATNNQFSYTDASGNPQVIDIAALVKSSETITTVTKDPTTSVYTYKNEAGANVNIDVIGDVKNSFSDIINNPAVKTLLEQFVTNTKGAVSFNATNNQFSYTDASGNPQVIDIAALVKSSETITTVTKDPTTSIYTYKNEAGANVNIDVIGDVKNSFSDIINNPAVKNLLEQFVTNTKGTVSFNATNNQFSYTDASGTAQLIDIAALVKSSETITTVTKDPTTSVYTYKNEAGANVNIDVIGDVKNSFSDIINNPAVKNLLEQFVTNSRGTVSFNATNNQFSYTDASGNPQVIDIAALVKSAETQTSLRDIVTQGTDGIGQTFDIHTLTFTDEKGIANVIDLATLVKGVETLTSLSYDGPTHSLIYNDEKGSSTHFNMIDLIGETQTLTKIAVNSTTGALEYTDENKQLNNIDLSQAVREPWYNSATNTGATSNTDNIYTKGWVGIGYTTASTDNPNEKLRVNGSISSVNGSYADYVFEDYFKGKSIIKEDYKFKTLKEVDDFIRINKHLPGITPITKLTKTDGGYSFNLSELSIQLLEKTEELYLHIIEQQKQLDQKEKEINDLKLRMERLEGLILKR